MFNVGASLLVLGKDRLFGVFEHDHFKLEFAILVHEFVTLILELLQQEVVLLDHLLFQKLVFLVKLKDLFLVDGQRLQQILNFFSDCHDIARVEELVVEKLLLLVQRDGFQVATVQAATT